MEKQNSSQTFPQHPPWRPAKAQSNWTVQNHAFLHLGGQNHVHNFLYCCLGVIKKYEHPITTKCVQSNPYEENKAFR